MTDSIPDTAAALAELDQQLAMLAEGFCPRCGGRLRAHDLAEQTAAATWASPPHAYCAHCHADVGSRNGGWFVGFRQGLNITTMRHQEPMRRGGRVVWREVPNPTPTSRPFAVKEATDG